MKCLVGSSEELPFFYNSLSRAVELLKQGSDVIKFPLQHFGSSVEKGLGARRQQWR